MDLLKRSVFVIAVLGFVAALIPQGCTKPETPQATADAVSKAPPPPAPAKAEPEVRDITLPEGTPLKIRITTVLSTKTHKTGDTFVATLEEPLVQDGQIVAPKGAQVEGRVVESDPGGRVKGRARLAIMLARLHTADGQVVNIRSNTVSRQARATKGQDATKIGIGSGVGAAIGAIAGGGRGAAIGAASGAAAGGGLVLATHGAPAVFAPETVLQFKLRAPVTIARK